MKNRIFAISLLLSFLGVMSHEMIPHHHHEAVVLNFSISDKQDVEHELKFHHEEEHQHHHDSEKEEKKNAHKHSFPFHQHISPTNNVFIERTNLLESNAQIIDISFLVYTTLFRIDFSKPPNLLPKRLKNSSLLIFSLNYLEALVLRGPPSFV